MATPAEKDNELLEIRDLRREIEIYRREWFELRNGESASPREKELQRELRQMELDQHRETTETQQEHALKINAIELKLALIEADRNSRKDGVGRITVGIISLISGVVAVAIEHFLFRHP